MLSSFTAYFLKDFFPQFHRILFGIAETIDYQLITCHGTEVVVKVSEIGIRNPTLLPTQIAGVLIGLYGLQLSRSWYWSMLYFMCMNLTSIYCHNISTKYTFWWRVARLLDIVFTGSSASCLLFTRFRVSNVVNVGIFPLLLLINYLFDFGPNAIPFLPEVTYIGTMLLALFYLLPTINKRGATNAKILCIIGLVLLLTGLPIDSLLCHYETQLTSVHFIFLGSNFAMMGLQVLSQQPEQANLKKVQ